MSTFTFDLFPSRSIYLALFNNVRNAAEIRKRLLAGDLEYAFINARLVVDALSVLVAANKAVAAQEVGKLTTRNVHSELVYNLGAVHSIAETLRKFGITDDCKRLVVASFDAKSDVESEVCALVEGDLVPLSLLGTDIDEAFIKKHYKVSAQELAIGTLGDAISGRISGKDAA
eukprot:tig00000319_g24143.t1